MTNPAVRTAKKREDLETVVVRILACGAAHGQSIARQAQSSLRSSDLEDGQVYPLLHRLERDGRVRSEWQSLPGLRKRPKYYRLTDAGRRTSNRVSRWDPSSSQSVVGIIVTLCVATTSLRASSDEERLAAIDVFVCDAAQAPSDIVSSSGSQVTAIFARIGVRANWVSTCQSRIQIGSLTVSDGATQRFIARIAIVRTRPDRSKDGRGNVLARTRVKNVAPYSDSVVYYDEVRTFSEAGDGKVALLMGHVIAHEIGHALLSSVSHPRDGIMRGNWRKHEIDLAVHGQLLFSITEAQAIRTTLMHGCPGVSDPGSSGCAAIASRQ